MNTAGLQAKLVPKLIQKLEEFGQTVTIRRPGQPDERHRALLYQMDDTDKTAKVSDPEFKLMTWQGIFKPDAPVRQLPFTVIDAQGRPFAPDGPTQDPGEQGVALLAHLLPADRARVESLTFTIPGVGTVRDAKGNLVPAPGVPLTVPARLSVTDDPRVRDMVGADSASAVLIGRWGTFSRPLLRPNGVRWGSTSPLTLDGQAGTLTVKLAYPDLDLAQEAQFGGRFVATWRAG